VIGGDVKREPGPSPRSGLRSEKGLTFRLLLRGRRRHYSTVPGHVLQLKLVGVLFRNQPTEELSYEVDRARVGPGFWALALPVPWASAPASFLPQGTDPHGVPGVSLPHLTGG
jgi:hypothetical protein